MKTKDIMTITSVAIGTATLTVLAFWSGSLEAGNEGDLFAAKNTKPTLVANGIELTLAAADGRSYQAGDAPAFELRAVNTTAESASAAVRIAMTASAPADKLSRVIRIPAVLWQQPLALALKPNETKVVLVTVDSKLPANQMISVSLEKVDAHNQTTDANPQVRSVPRLLVSASSGIVALNFFTAVAAPQPAIALAR